MMLAKNILTPIITAKYLSAQEASLAYKLSDKSIGIIYPGMTRYPAGTQRGDTKDSDYLFFDGAESWRSPRAKSMKVLLQEGLQDKQDVHRFINK